MIAEVGLGTKLRLLISLLDGELSGLYERQGQGFRPRFFPVFQLLLARKKASVSEIAAHMQASQPAATQTLAEMKRLKFIAYETGRDRRERIVKLTPYAVDLVPDLRPIWDAVRCAASQIDDELPYPLSAILDEALSALARKSFSERISECGLPEGH